MPAAARARNPEREVSVSRDLFWLTLVALMTALFWLPYILNRMVELGPWKTMQNPEPGALPKAAWAYRAQRAHTNAVENLVVFAALVLAAVASGASNDITAMAAAVYFWARALHFLVYTAGIPVARTLTFAAGWGAQVVIAWQILGHA